ncbi:MAG TPA: Panacea domain-containing protein [Planctomycetota bacterium]|nr:Panacea domain-containing protein [Planctomycetota bacterium]
MTPTPTFPYHFNFKKALQSAAFLLSLEDQCMNYMRLLKLLYIADRESLKQTGEPITSDAPYAMERGPVPTRIFDFIKGTHVRAPEWEAYIKTDNYNAVLENDPGRGALSRYDIDTLSMISAKFRAYDEWAMVKYCHDHLEEWQKNNPGTSSKAIPLKDILVAVGVTNPDAIIQDACDQFNASRRVLSVLP